MTERVVPFYLACDESYSMAGHIEPLNSGLRELHHAVGTDALVARKTRFCLVGFSGRAEVLLPLSRLSDITEMARLTAKVATSFGAVFDLLRVTIERDLDTLRWHGYRAHRPVVFFLSDGQPTDPLEWQVAHERLVDRSRPARPDLVAFGIGAADAGTIGRIGTCRAFLSWRDCRPSAAVCAFLGTLACSIATAGTSAAQGGCGGGYLPERVPGFTTLTGGAA